MATPKLEVDPKEVLRIFSMRAGGATIEGIAAEYPFSSATVAAILHRERDADVLIPPKILEAVQKSLPPRRNKKRATPAVSTHMALVNYMTAVVEMRKAKETCLRLGMSADMLTQLRDAEANLSNCA